MNFPHCEILGEFKLTRADKIRNMSDEELAKLLCTVRERCFVCGAKGFPDREHCPLGNDKCMNNPHEFKAWLREKHE